MDLRTIAKIWPCATALFLASFFLTVSAVAGTIWLTLDDVPAVACDEVWLDQEIPMWFTSTEGEVNFPIGCVFDPDAEVNGFQGVYLGPGRLVIDVSGVQGADRIYMDVHNILGSVRAHMMDGTERVYYHALSRPGDLLMFLPILGGDHILLSVADGYVTEIRLEGEALAVENTSFGAVKVLYGR